MIRSFEWDNEVGYKIDISALKKFCVKQTTLENGKIWAYFRAYHPLDRISAKWDNRVG